jgi:hypothetical protein
MSDEAFVFSKYSIPFNSSSSAYKSVASARKAYMNLQTD